MSLFVGFEIGTAKEVKIPIFHQLVTGQTRLSGKTTLLKALARQAAERGFKILVVDSKTNFADFESFGQEVPVCLQESMDSLIIIGLLESIFRRKITVYYATLTRLAENAKTYEDVIRNAEQLRDKSSGFQRDACAALIDLLKRLQLQTTKVKTTATLTLPYQINRMSINDFDLEAQQLIVKSTLDEALRKFKKLIVILDEAYKFCLSKDTDVLTERGWKQFPKLTMDDVVLTLNQNKNELEYQKIQDIIVQDFKGYLNHVNGKTVDILATEDHRHVIERNIRTKKNGKYVSYWAGKTQIIQFAKLPRAFRIPASGKFFGSSSKYSPDFASLLGWIITDGHAMFYKKKPYIIRISQIKSDTTQQIEFLLNNLHLPNKKYMRKRMTTLPNGARYSGTETVFTFPRKISKQIIQALNGSIHRIPRWVYIAPIEVRQHLFASLMAGDGTQNGTGRGGRPNSSIFYCHSKELSDDIQELCAGLGLRATIGFNKLWRVYISHHGHHYVKKRNIQKEKYEGKVYDITVPNGTFIARRNGRMFITGNCPQKYSSACMKSVLDFTTQSGATECYLWMGTQFLAPTNKDAMKTMAVKLLGTQDHDTECEHTLDLIPFIKGKFTKDTIMRLALGHFIVVTKTSVQTVYACPEYADRNECREVALDRRDPKNVHYLIPMTEEQVKEVQKKPTIEGLDEHVRMSPINEKTVTVQIPKVEPAKPKPERPKPQYFPSEARESWNERFELMQNNVESLRLKLNDLIKELKNKTPEIVQVQENGKTVAVNLKQIVYNVKAGKIVKSFQLNTDSNNGKVMWLAKEGFFNDWRTANEVLNALVEKRWAIPRGSIYSTLNFLAKKGFLGVTENNKKEDVWALPENVKFIGEEN